MSRALAALTVLLPLAACNVDPESISADWPQASWEDVSADALGTDVQLPPPGDLDLNVDGSLETGSALTFQVTNAPANASIWIVRGADAGGLEAGACPSVLGGVCLAINGPIPMFSINANANGQASRTLQVPSLPEQAMATFQAVVLAGANTSTSNPQIRHNPWANDSNDSDYEGLVLLGWEGAGQLGASGSFSGYEDQFFAAANATAGQIGYDACRLRWDGTAATPTTVPCADCEFQFAVDLTPAGEAGNESACMAVMAIDAATYQLPKSADWGFDQDFAYNGSTYAIMWYFDPAGGAWIPGVNTTGAPSSVGAFNPAAGSFEYVWLAGYFYY